MVLCLAKHIWLGFLKLFYYSRLTVDEHDITETGKLIISRLIA